MEERPAADATTQLRALWERRWRERSGTDFHWYISQPPEELEDLLRTRRLPPGGALDLGCGSGVVALRLAEDLRPVVGLDIAFGVVAEAANAARGAGSAARFIVGAAPLLPLRTGSLALVFDRGCLQALRPREWPTYFEEVSRVLVPGGVLQLYASRPVTGLAGASSFRAVRTRLRSALKGRTRPEPRLDPDAVRRLVPPTMRVAELREQLWDLTSRDGKERKVTYAVIEKRP